jgi:GTP cyclohydrolase II
MSAELIRIRKARCALRVPLEIPPTPATLHYLRTKKEKIGHLLESV